MTNPLSDRDIDRVMDRDPLNLDRSIISEGLATASRIIPVVEPKIPKETSDTVSLTRLILICPYFNNEGELRETVLVEPYINGAWRWEPWTGYTRTLNLHTNHSAEFLKSYLTDRFRFSSPPTDAKEMLLDKGYLLKFTISTATTETFELV